MPDLPTGTITFLFTDVEGSTKLWERSPEAMSEAIARHHESLREAIESRGGYVLNAWCEMRSPSQQVGKGQPGTTKLLVDPHTEVVQRQGIAARRARSPLNS